jgi:hypothetical protein
MPEMGHWIKQPVTYSTVLADFTEPLQENSRQQILLELVNTEYLTVWSQSFSK